MSTKITVPTLGESVVEARVARWLKSEGDQVAVGEPLVELETEKVNLEVGAEQAGILAKIERREGESLRPGDVLGLLEASSNEQRSAAQATQSPQKEPAPDTSTDGAEGQAKATPVARRLADERRVDLTGVPGSGPGGRITKRDVEDHVARQDTANRPASPMPTQPSREPIQPVQPVTDAQTTRHERQRLSLRRKTIARRLVEAQHTAAMLTTFNDVDMSAVMRAREKHKEDFQKRHGVSLGIVSFFVKAAVAALKAIPQLNSELKDDELIIKHHYDVGVAIAAPDGLVVPVLRDADRKSFAEIEKAIHMYVKAAEENTLSLEDLRGGTFTITNGGVFGSLLSTPILNPPQAGILGLHRIEDRPVARDGQVVIRAMMYVALTYDHRIVDGREAVRFLNHIKQLVESPEALLFES
jgi:2-oxoglutarate dehydrogenase E2 component (dihydrolipoamide succinyltransferase)